MLVITLDSCPNRLRGDLTKWLLEINQGVYVGQVNAKVRDELWERVVANVKRGRATMTFSSNNEQHLEFRVHNSNWEVVDYDGINLILHPSVKRIQQNLQSKTSTAPKLGFSKAAQRRIHKKTVIKQVQNEN
jgi:CRISPR-associated protein Cas2